MSVEELLKKLLNLYYAYENYWFLSIKEDSINLLLFKLELSKTKKVKNSKQIVKRISESRDLVRGL